MAGIGIEQRLYEDVTGHGAMPSQELRQMAEAGFIDFSQSKSPEGKRIQPASMDFSALPEDVYEVPGGIMPKTGETVFELIKKVGGHRLKYGAEMRPGATYVVPVAEKIRLPDELYAFANTKSSVGRNSVLAKILADGVPRHDKIPKGFRGKIWFMISSGHFPFQVAEGDRISQVRVFDRDTRFDPVSMRLAFEKYELLFRANGTPYRYEELKIEDHDGSLVLTIDLETPIDGNDGAVGYVAKEHTPVLKLEGSNDLPAFFDPVPKPESGFLKLEKGKFYLFKTAEYSRIPPCFAAEMRAMNRHSGEYRSNKAGYGDAGFGYGRTGSIKGRPFVLEIEPSVHDLMVRHHQPIANLDYERLRAIPDLVYGDDKLGSSYTHQRHVVPSRCFNSK